MTKKVLIITTILVFILGGGYYFIFYKNSKNAQPPKTENIELKKVTKPKETLLYGIKSDDYIIKSDVVELNDYLGAIFSKYHIGNKLQKVLQKIKDVFDVRKIKSGQKYTLFMQKDSLHTVDYFIYEKNKTDYIVFDLKDSVNIYEGHKKVEVVVKETGGVINSNLWFAMEDAGVKPVLANDLSDIYAWTVDFFGLQKNDKFKLIYEEQFVNDTSIGYGKIIAAYFEHYGDTIYAIPFVQDSIESFYDIDGTSLRKTFLKAPLKFSRISSGFSYARKHPILKIVRPHLGVDYAAPAGTPVYALGDGVVQKAYYTRGGGNFVRIKHNSVYSTGYLHLRGFAKGIHAGVRVKQGQIIGYVGSTGLSTGPHLDFRVWKNGKNINPLHLKAPPVKPVKQENMADYNKIKEAYKKRLDSIGYAMKKDTVVVNDTADVLLTVK